MTNKTLQELKEAQDKASKASQEPTKVEEEASKANEEPTKANEATTKIAELEKTLAEAEAELVKLGTLVASGKVTNHIEHAYLTIEADKALASTKASLNVARFDVERERVANELGEILATIKPTITKLAYEVIVNEDKSTRIMVKFNDEVTSFRKASGNGKGARTWTNGKETLSSKDLASKVSDKVKQGMQGTINSGAWGNVIDTAMKSGELAEWSEVKS